MNFKNWIIKETINPSKYVYHVTYYRNLDNISEEGLNYSEHGGSNFYKPHIQSNSRLGNFFSDDINGVKFWISTLEGAANDKSDNVLEDGLVPIILKFKLNQNKWIKDPSAERTSGDYYTNKMIPPQGIQMWNGMQWIPISSDLNLYDFVDVTEEDGEQIVYIKNPYSKNTGYPLPIN